MGELDSEYALFERALPELLREHRGAFALFHDGNVVALHASYHDAYVAGLDAFGLDGRFLIAEITEQRAAPISMSWQNGVMFDPT